MQVILQCPNLEKLEAGGCTGLETLLLWSDKLTELDITDAKVPSAKSIHHLILSVGLWQVRPWWGKADVV